MRNSHIFSCFTLRRDGYRFRKLCNKSEWFKLNSHLSFYLIHISFKYFLLSSQRSSLFFNCYYASVIRFPISFSFLFLFVIDCSCFMLTFMGSSQTTAATNTVASRMCPIAFASISYFHNLPYVLTWEIDMLSVTLSKPMTIAPLIH